MTIKGLINKYKTNKLLAEEVYSRPSTNEERELYPIILASKLRVYDEIIADLKKLEVSIKKN